MHHIEKTVLGLDIGVASIGWAIVKLTEEQFQNEKADGTIEDKYKIVDGEIINAGVRSFQLPQDRQKKSLAAIRGQARRIRKTNRRKTQRLKKLIRLSREYELIGSDFSRDQVLKPQKGDTEINWDIWSLRKQALERKISDTEFFRILYHIAKHRGFYFHTKAEEMDTSDSEDAKVKQGLKQIQEELRKSDCLTIGQYFYQNFKQADGKRKRNRENSYEHSIHRLLLKEEIEHIFKKQRELNNPKASKELEKRYTNEILLCERGVNEDKLLKMMSRCEFERGRLCAPKESYTAEKFMLLNRINTLQLIDTSQKDKYIVLSEEQKNAIRELAYQKKKVTFTQIRSALKLKGKPELRFNLCSYTEKNPEYNKKLYCEIKNGKLQFNENHKISLVNIKTGEVTVLNTEVKEVFGIRKIRPGTSKIYIYYSDIRKHHAIPNQFRFEGLSGYTKSEDEFAGDELEYIKQFEKQTFIQLEGWHSIKKAVTENCSASDWEALEQNPEKIDVIAEALTYRKKDSSRIQYLTENGITDQRLIQAVLSLTMKQLANFSSAALTKLIPFMEKGQLFHEAKEKCGYGKIEYTKQELLEPYKGFFETNPVVARVISQTRKVINALIRKYQSQHPIDQIFIEVATELASSEKRKREISLGQHRYREEKETAIQTCIEFGLDPKEGQNLLMFRLARQQNFKCPYTGMHIAVTPTGAKNEINIFDCEIDHIIPMSRSFNDSLNNKVLCAQAANQNKKNRIPYEWIMEEYGPDRWNEFEIRTQNSKSIPYPKRRNLLKKSWTEKDKEIFLDRNLNDTRYAARHVADYLRKYFDFSKSSRKDIKEVSRIQLRSGGVTSFLRHIWGLTKDRKENDLHHALDALVVACSTPGHVYLVSNLAANIERKGKNWYKHFARDSFKPWKTIREDFLSAIESIFVSRMPRRVVTGSAHKEKTQSFQKPSRKRIIKVNEGFADLGPMARADFYVDGKGQNFAIPIYPVDIYSHEPLPDKYIDKSDQPYSQWPSVTDNDLKFRFSLYKDDLISINGQMFYVSFVKGTRPIIAVKNVDGSLFDDGYREKEISYRRVELKKFSVDLLGTYKEIRQERRVGSRFAEAEKQEKKGGKQ